MLKIILIAEGSELTTICSQLKMKAQDGKMYLTDTLDTEVYLDLFNNSIE